MIQPHLEANLPSSQSLPLDKIQFVSAGMGSPSFPSYPVDADRRKTNDSGFG